MDADSKNLPTSEHILSRRTTIVGLAIPHIIAPSFASTLLESTSKQDPKPASQSADAYKMVIVFQRTKGGTEVGGVIPVASASAILRRIVAKTPPTKAGERAQLQKRTTDTDGDIELWMVSDGVLGSAVLNHRTRNVHFPQLLRSFGISSEYRELQAEIGSLAGIKPVEAVPASGSASHPSFPFTLAQMCREADIIVVGRAVAVLRDAPTPINRPNSGRRHTVIAVAVDGVLKQFEPLASPVLKVSHVGGKGIRINSEGRAVPFQSVGDPMLAVGQQYVLFLKSILAGPEAERMLKKGYIPANIDGVEGPAGELDEVWLMHGLAGHFLVRDGVLAPPNSETRGWRFHFGPQLMGLPLMEALSLIRRELANPAGP